MTQTDCWAFHPDPVIITSLNRAALPVPRCAPVSITPVLRCQATRAAQSQRRCFMVTEIWCWSRTWWSQVTWWRTWRLLSTCSCSMSAPTPLTSDTWQVTSELYRYLVYLCCVGGSSVHIIFVSVNSFDITILTHYRLIIRTDELKKRPVGFYNIN